MIPHIRSRARVKALFMAPGLSAAVRIVRLSRTKRTALGQSPRRNLRYSFNVLQYASLRSSISPSASLKRLTHGHKAVKLTGLFVIVLTVAIGVFSSYETPKAQAAASNYLNFQARLLTNTGGLVADGNYNIEFKLYDASGSSGSSQGSCSGDAHCLWTETRTGGNQVRVVNGYFSVNLGSVTGFGSTINWDQQMWLTMNIGGTGGSPSWDGEMSPRIQLTALPLAFYANHLASGTGSSRGTLNFASFGQATDITLPDPGAGTATVCYQNASACGFATGSGAAVILQGTTPGSQQTGNFNISGTGIAGTSLQTALLDAATASSILSIGTTNASAINLNQNTAVASNKSFTANGSALFKDATNSTTAFQIQNSSSSALLTGDTTNMRLGVDVTYTAMSAPTSPAASAPSQSATPTVTPTGTTGGTQYKYIIIANLSTGQSSASAAGTTNTGNATLSTTNYNALSWTAFGGSPTSYNIYRSTSAGTPSTLGYIGNSTTNSFNDTGFPANGVVPTVGGGLSTSTTYYYKVTAIDSAGGESAASSEVSATTGAGANTTQTINVSWTAVTGATGYKVYRATSSGSEVYLVNVTTNYYADTGYATAGSATPPTTGTAYTSTNNSNNSLQISIGGLGTPTGQAYVSGTQPFLTGTTPILGFQSGFTSLGSMIYGNYAYVMDSQNGRLSIYDITNPVSPIGLSQLNLTTGRITVSGKYLYDATSSTSIKVVDVTNPSSPTIVNTVSMPSESGRKLLIKGSYLYVATLNTLQIYDISNPTNPVIISTTQINSGNSVEGIDVQGKYAYVITNSNPDFIVIDISNPALPSIVGSVQLNSGGGHQLYSLKVQGRYAYAKNGNDGIHLIVVDISDPTQPVQAGSVGDNINCNTFDCAPIYIQGRFAYVAGLSGTYIEIFDISNPVNPVLLNGTSNPSSGASIGMVGRYLYYTNQTTKNVEVYDVGGAYIQQLQTGGIETSTLNVEQNATFGSGNILGSLNIGQNLQAAGNVGIGGGLNVQGTSVLSGGANQLATPGAPTVSPQGTTGSQRWDYTVTAINAYGAETVASTAGTTSSGNATLSSSNYNQISWSAVSGASGYKIYRTYATSGTPSTTGLIGSTSSTSFNDTGIGANSITSPTINTTGQLTVQGAVLFQNTSNSTTAFQVQNSSGTSYLDVDTTNGRVGIGNSAPSYALDVTGDVNSSANIRTGGSVRIDSSGNYTGGTINTNTFSNAGVLLFGNAGAATIDAASGQNLTVGGSASNHTTTLGSTNGTSTTTVQSGSGGINLTGAVSISGSNTFTSGTGNISLQGDTSLTKSLALNKGNDFSTNGTTNNASFSDASVIRLTGSAAQTITGIANGRDGYVLTIINAGANTATISNDSSGSSNGNKIYTGTGGDILMPTNSSITLVYDAGSNYWRVTGSVAATGGAANTALSNLTTTSINQDLLPSGAGAHNLGTNALPWGNLFLGGSANKAVSFDTSALTTNRTITFSDNAGTVALLSPTAQQTGNLNISGTVTAGTYNGNTFDNAGNLTFGNAGAASINAVSGQNLSIGNGASNHTTVLGSTNGTSTTNIQSGSGGINFNGAVAITGSNTFQSGTGTVQLQGATTVSANFIVTNAGTVAFQKATDNSTTGNLNNLSIAGALIRFTGSSTQTLTGITAGADGRLITLVNAAGQSMIIKNNDTTDSTSTNVIFTGTGSDITLLPDSSITVVYDSGASEWRVISSAAVTGGGANTALSNLITTSINQDLLPSGAGARNLGTNALPWGNLFIGSAGANKAASFDTSALTTNRTITFSDNAGTVALLSPTAQQSGNLNISGTITSGNITAGTYNGNTFNSSGTLLFGNAGAASINAATGQDLSISTNASNHTTTLGTTNGTATTTIQSGSGGINLNGVTTVNNSLVVSGSNTFQSGTGTVQLQGDTTVSANFIVTNAGTVAFQKATDNSTTGNLNDLSIAGALIRFTGASTQTLTGISGGTNGRLITLVNAASQALTINNNDSVNSASTDVIITGTGSAIAVPAGGSIGVVYDSTAQVWRIIASTATGGGFANTALSNLTTTSINQDLLPSGAGARNLGTATLPWGNLFLGGSASKAVSFDTSALTTNRTITFSDNAGTVALLNPTAQQSGNLNTSGSVNGGSIQTGGNTRIDGSGNLSNIGNIALTGTISGGTTVTGSGNFNSTGGSLQTNSTTRVDNSGNLTNIGNITATATSTAGASLSGYASGSGTALTVNTNAATNVGEIIAGASSQSADLLQIQDSTTANLLNVDASGDLAVSSGYINTAYGGLGTYANLIARSEQFDNAAWAKTNSTGTANQVQGPDNTGANTADTIHATSSGGKLANASSTAVSNTNSTFSVWLRTTAGNTQQVDLRIDGSSSGTGTASRVTITGTWQRFKVTQNTNGFSGNVTAVIFPGTTGGTDSQTVYAWGGQLVQASTPGVYVRTVANTVAAADGLINNGQAIFIDSSDSTTAYQFQTSSQGAVLDIDTTNTRVGIGLSNPSYPLDVVGDINGSANIRTGGTIRLDGSGNLSNIGNIGLTGSISGGTTYSGSGNINTTGGVLQTGSQTRVDNSGNLTNIGNFTATAGSTFLTTGANGFTFKVGTDNATAFQFQNASSRNLIGVNSSTSTITIGNSTDGATFTIGGAGGSGTFTNNGSTKNTTLALGDLAGGSIGSAASTVDIYSSFSISPTAGGRTYTIPAPTDGGVGRLIYISNINGSNTFTIGSTVFNTHSTGTLVYDGTSWNFAGMDGGSNNYIQNQTAADQSASFRIAGTGQITSSNASAFKVQNTSNRSLFNVDATNTTVTIGNSTDGANLTIGGAAGSGVFTNNGSTLNTTLALGDLSAGSIGAANATVDIYTSFSIAPTAANRTYTIPTPTASTSYGRMIYISNIAASGNYFKIGSATINPGATASLIWSNTNGGASWQFAGADAGNLQTAYTNATGGSTPEIKIDSTRGGVDLQDADSALNASIFTIRNSNSSGLGAAIFDVQSANPLSDITNNTTNNLVSNGSFEANVTGWAAKGSASAPAQNSIYKYIGSSSLKEVTTANANDGTSYNVTLSDSTAYSLVFSLRLDPSSNSFATLAAGYNNGSSDSNCTLNSSTVVSTGWTTYSCTFTTASSHSGTPYIYIKQTDGVIHTIYLDGVQLSRYSLLSNASAEVAFTANDWQKKTGSETSVTQVSSQAEDGSNSVQVVTTGSTQGTKHNETLNDSTSYNITFWAKASGSNFSTLEAGYNDGSTNTVCITAQTVVTTGWTSYNCTLITTASHSGTPYFYVDQTDGTGRTFFLDNFQMTIGVPAGNYREGTVALNGTITSPVAIQGASNSTTAFQLQNAAGNNVMVVDSINKYLKIYENNGNTNYALIYYDSSTSTATYTANSGTVAVGPGAGAITVIAGSGSSVSITANAASTWQTTAGTLTLKTTASGQDLILSAGSSGGLININSANAFKLGSNAGDFGTCTAGALFYNTSTNKLRGCEGSTPTWNDLVQTTTTLQAAYTASTGGTTPEIKLDSTRTGLDIQDANSTIGASLLNVRASSGGGLGTALFSVGNTGDVTIQSSASIAELNTSNTDVSIGHGNSPASTNPIILVLDNYQPVTAGAEPTEQDGAMYYDADNNIFRCGVSGLWKNCNINDIQDTYVLEDEFAGGTTTTGAVGDLNWNLSTITGGAPTYAYNTTMTPTADRPGTFGITTPATNTDGATLWLGGAGTTGTLITNLTMDIKTSVAVGATTTSMVLRVGTLNETTGTASGNEGVWVDYDSSASANWRYCYGTGAAATCNQATTGNGFASTHSIAASTWVSIEIRVVDSTHVTYCFDGDCVNKTVTGLGVTNRTNPAMACVALSANARNCYIDYYQISATTGAAR